MLGTQAGSLLDDHGTWVATVMHGLLPCDWMTLFLVDRTWRHCQSRSWAGSRLPAADAVGRRLDGCFAPSHTLPQDLDEIIEHPVLCWLRHHPHGVDPLRLDAATHCEWSTDGHDGRLHAGRTAGRASLLVVPLPTKAELLAAWLFTRTDGAFDLPELDVVRLFAPGLRQRWRVGLLRQKGLTHRELEVLELAAAGLTATSIARSFRISARTVHKHLEHTYTKLGCHDRLSAVLILRDAGLLRDGADVRHAEEGRAADTKSR